MTNKPADIEAAEVIDLRRIRIQKFMRAYFEERAHKLENIRKIAEDWDKFVEQSEVVVD